MSPIMGIAILFRLALLICGFLIVKRLLSNGKKPRPISKGPKTFDAQWTEVRKK